MLWNTDRDKTPPGKGNLNSLRVLNNKLRCRVEKPCHACSPAQRRGRLKSSQSLRCNLALVPREHHSTPFPFVRLHLSSFFRPCIFPRPSLPFSIALFRSYGINNTFQLRIASHSHLPLLCSPSFFAQRASTSKASFCISRGPSSRARAQIQHCLSRNPVHSSSYAWIFCLCIDTRPPPHPSLSLLFLVAHAFLFGYNTDHESTLCLASALSSRSLSPSYLIPPSDLRLDLACSSCIDPRHNP